MEWAVLQLSSPIWNRLPTKGHSRKWNTAFPPTVCWPACRLTAPNTLHRRGTSVASSSAQEEEIVLDRSSCLFLPWTGTLSSVQHYLGLSGLILQLARNRPSFLSFSLPPHFSFFLSTKSGSWTVKMKLRRMLVLVLWGFMGLYFAGRFGLWEFPFFFCQLVWYFFFFSVFTFAFSGLV